MTFKTSHTTALDIGNLLLTPATAHARPPIATVLHLIQTAGLIGSAISTENHRYRFGEHLFDLIAFTGCAVQLPSATDTGNGLEVRLEGPFSAPQLRVGRNSRPPRCPVCQRPLADWREKAGSTVDMETAGTQRLQCKECDAANPVWAWQWGRHAGAGSFFVVVAPVFPGEAQPLPMLLETLSRAGVGPWHYFYVQK